MADVIHAIFKNKKVNLSKLLSFGGEQKGSHFVYEKMISESEFKVRVTITMQGEVTAGSFVGEIKMQYEETLTEMN